MRCDMWTLLRAVTPCSGSSTCPQRPCYRKSAEVASGPRGHGLAAIPGRYRAVMGHPGAPGKLNNYGEVLYKYWLEQQRQQEEGEEEEATATDPPCSSNGETTQATVLTPLGVASAGSFRGSAAARPGAVSTTELLPAAVLGKLLEHDQWLAGMEQRVAALTAAKGGASHGVGKGVACPWCKDVLPDRMAWYSFRHACLDLHRKEWFAQQRPK
ncbi:hypothetical protein CYMTET_24103 [Cymbomonas tetramitiformis]|uniref:Uncharacterized protein n=1 Tax=Cymbomonas tetramitiformis TaxID=36881 RepID=A0AAE0L0A0_9CHLO|nr:hypothetical protein CYMTET_24103 [Cymbomonas tetramitiformis]